MASAGHSTRQVWHHLGKPKPPQALGFKLSIRRPPAPARAGRLSDFESPEGGDSDDGTGRA